MRAAGVWGCVVAAMAAAGLGACAPRDAFVTGPGKMVGNWLVERSTDRVTGSQIPSAFLTTRTVSTTSIVFPPPANLQLSCFKGDAIARFSFLFKVGSNRTVTVGYRFDEKPGHDDIEVRLLQDYHTVLIEDPAEMAKFVRELAASQVLYIRIRSLNAGRTSAEFRLDGAPDAIQSALADCPVKAEAPPAPKPNPPARRRGM